VLVGTIDIHAIDMGWAFPGRAEGDESAVEAAAGSDARINALASKRAGDKASNNNKTKRIEVTICLFGGNVYDHEMQLKVKLYKGEANREPS